MCNSPPYTVRAVAQPGKGGPSVIRAKNSKSAKLLPENTYYRI